MTGIASRSRAPKRIGDDTVAALRERLAADGWAPIRASTLSGGAGFANAILGPSHNYELPTYAFADGEEVARDEIDAIRAIAENCTHEIN